MPGVVRAGMNSGRIQAVADTFADTGFTVIIPDLFEGEDVAMFGGFSSPEVRPARALCRSPWYTAVCVPACTRLGPCACSRAVRRAKTG